MIQHLNPLIDKTTIAKYKEISDTVLPKKLNPHILSAQREDVKPLLGERLYNDLVRNREDHEELLKGGDYTHEGTLYFSDGLECVLALYANARYIYLGQTTDTPFGHVNKLNSSGASTPISEASRKSEWLENRKEAFGCWQTVKDYLIRMDYDLFNDDLCENKSSQGGGFMNFEVITKY